MIIEVGNTYRGSDGAFWTIKDERYSDFSREFKFVGFSEGNSVRYFDKDGRTGDIRLICKYEPTVEDTRLVWEWKTPDEEGIWAYGGTFTELAPKVLSVDLIENVKSAFCLKCWRCYLGPVPKISQPKKPVLTMQEVQVKQTLWMVKYYTMGTWQELWLPDEEVPKHRDYQDISHKTSTTRTV